MDTFDVIYHMLIDCNNRLILQIKYKLSDYVIFKTTSRWTFFVHLDTLPEEALITTILGGFSQTMLGLLRGDEHVHKLMKLFLCYNMKLFKRQFVR